MRKRFAVEPNSLAHPLNLAPRPRCLGAARTPRGSRYRRLARWRYVVRRYRYLPPGGLYRMARIYWDGGKPPYRPYLRRPISRLGWFRRLLYWRVARVRKERRCPPR